MAGNVKDYNIKSIREDFKSKGIFYTPKELAEFLKSFVDVESNEVYDPTCGHGSLLSVFDDSVKKYGQDVNVDAINYLHKHHKEIDARLGDTILEDKFKGKKFKVILANPPFSIKYDDSLIDKEDERFKDAPCLPPKSKADYLFILHILNKLKDDGVAVVLNFPGILYRGQREGKIRKYLVEKNYIDSVIAVPGNKFVDTTIASCVLVLRKNKRTTDIKFIDDEKKIEKIAKVDEVKENNFNLAVNNYAYEEVEKIILTLEDRKKMQDEAHESLLNHIRWSLNSTRFICDLEDFDFKPYYESALNCIKEFEIWT